MKKYSFRVPASARGFRSGAAVTFPFAAETSPRIVGGYVNKGVLMEGDEIQTLSSDYLVNGVIKGKAGDIWLHITLLDEVEVVDGWTAVRHMGVDIAPLVENLPQVYPNYRSELLFTSDQQIEIYRVTDTGDTLLISVPAGQIKIISDPMDLSQPFLQIP